MRKRVVFDVLRITLAVRPGIDVKEAAAIRRTLDGRSFKERLKKSVKAAFGGFPTLRQIRFHISG
jgi:hypothetical protein